MEDSKVSSKIIVFGGTGDLGKCMVKASLARGHPTFVHTRPLAHGCNDSNKLETLKEFQAMGVTIIHGELDDHEKLVSTLRQVQIVISILPIPSFLEQLKIIKAMEEAGNIERFIPSEYGNEVDRLTAAMAPFQEILENKKRIRRATETAGIPFTFVSSNSRAAYFVYYVLFRHSSSNHVNVYGTGQTKAVLNYEDDIAAYTIRAATDPKTLNKIVICRPPNNIISQLDLISSWENKTGQTINKVYISEEQVISFIQTLPHPENVAWAILHSIFIKGDQMSFELGEDDLETSVLYPDYNYTSIDAFLDLCLVTPPDVKLASFA